MRPTLYANDTSFHCEGKDASEQFKTIRMVRQAQVKAVRRVLPRRCPNELCVDGENRAVGYLCGDCDGRGWLYPDPPAGWPKGQLVNDGLTDEWMDGWRFKPSDSEWESLCMTVWFAMGILEDES